MYLTEQYLNDAYGAEQVAAMCPTAGALSTTIELAEGSVESALRIGGYSTLVPSSVFSTIASVPAPIKLAAYRQWLILVHERHGISVEEETMKMWVQPIDDLRLGAIEIDAPVDTVRAVGGNSFTEGGTSSSTRDPVFAGERMGDF